MCGITGFVGKGSLDDLKRMSNTLIHRGPDDFGFFFDEKNKVFLAHRRLSIIDIESGNQPMWTLDKRIGIIFNGEIYNHFELKEELIKKSYKFKTDHSDTEVILHAYREWGVNCVNKFNGMWAFALYDIDKKIIFCSRDRFGKKPLYYTNQNSCFAFSSELTALKNNINLTLTISKKSLQKYFGYNYIPAPNTLYKEVKKLPGGYNLIFNISTSDIRLEKYWSFKIEPSIDLSKKNEVIIAETIYDLLEKSVKRRLVSDVPLGFFLSGGIDSSAIVGIASKYLKTNLNTFSVGFDDPSFDERRYAKLVSDIFHTQHRTENLTIDNALEIIPSLFEKLDEPIGDSSILPTFFLCKYVRRFVKVAISGDGGDELFAGYDPFKALRKAEFYNSIFPKPIHKAIKLLLQRIPVSHKNMSIDFKVKKTLQGLSFAPKFWVPVWMSSLDSSEIEELFDEKVELEDLYSEVLELWDSSGNLSLIDKTLQFYTNLYLQDNILVKADRASMVNSLEVRSPFLDIDLVEYIRKIPHEYKYKNGITKYILKKSLIRMLPNEILYRSKKGFGVPVGKWFYQNMLKVKLSNEHNIMDKVFIMKKNFAHSKGKEDNRLFLWNLFVLNQYI
ncbi:asparagine synthase (glutamine-hydrolyzing) [Leptospira noguchii]|uniref:asparagine synthase (glutamine-hydrolyzing) n=1 Tax=Leptospira noguchii serovar Autumnalis str. ZUN142 TaxID=1085540 RepID=M6UPR1_9LEPT|nr:asparagine synthase (glutamine-hydrolyzing) [Leptospira noguchii]EMO43009.1 asparagine synthase (glutamine-hydrolyzing) [Leptospira noguchii serovar Autumnalis str. ZUN142]EMS88497.1 asparagine synthase (glutamine-hydrolyzing) [Leptospira noguchii str. Hook]UOG47583.1 asparagine synthase (glutamine-hydrolyzing) [Leptospira noguchii]